MQLQCEVRKVTSTCQTCFLRFGSGKVTHSRTGPLGLLGLVAWQAASGLGNVLLGWPLAAAVAHTGGAAALVVVLALLLVRSAPRTELSAVGSGPSPALAAWRTRIG